MIRLSVTRSGLRDRRRRSLPLAAALVTVLIAAACAGPVATLEVGMNARSVELLLGERITAVTEAPVPPALPKGFADLPPLSSAPLPSSPPVVAAPPDDEIPVGKCPEAPADASLLNQVAHTATLPPAPKTYEYRTKGKVTVGDEVTRLPAITTREVADPREESTGSFLFDVITTVNEEETMATFRVVPSWFPEKPPDALLPPDNAPGGARVQPGLYLVRVDSSPDSSFRASDPGIKLVTFPVKPGASFTTAGTDGVTTMNFTSTVSSKRPRVDACGTLIDAYRIDLEGTMTKPTEQGTIESVFTSSYGVATQFGGLIVWEKTEVTSGEVSRIIAATINEVPADAKEPGGSK